MALGLDDLASEGARFAWYQEIGLLRGNALRTLCQIPFHDLVRIERRRIIRDVGIWRVQRARGSHIAD